MHKKEPPFQSDADGRPRNVGILAMDIYFPQRYVHQEDLQEEDGVGLKYTKGLGQEMMAFCDDCEDINSICMNAVQRLLDTYEVDPEDIGRLEVGTETLIDKSKSTKTNLMDLLQGNTSVCGVTTLNACYGGTEALLNACNWIESSRWDGRFALVVAGDIAIYDKGPARPTGGCGAVAMLVGPDAPIALDVDMATYSANCYDFYKPSLASEYPSVNGAHSEDCYFSALQNCFNQFVQKKQRRLQRPWSLMDVDNVVFHQPFHKLVTRAYSQLYFLDRCHAFLQQDNEKSLSNEDLEFVRSSFDKLQEGKGDHAGGGGTGVTLAGGDAEEPLDLRKHASSVAFVSQPPDSGPQRQSMRLQLSHCVKKMRPFDAHIRSHSSASFADKVSPASRVGKVLGNCYTASIYANLIGLIESTQMENGKEKLVLMYSYGSGMIASMFVLKFRTPTTQNTFTVDRISEKVELSARLEQRKRCSTANFCEALQRREIFNTKDANKKPIGCQDMIREGDWFLEFVDDKFQRKYKRMGGEGVCGFDCASS